jgi:hypothetical protein
MTAPDRHNPSYKPRPRLNPSGTPADVLRPLRWEMLLPRKGGPIPSVPPENELPLGEEWAYRPLIRDYLELEVAGTYFLDGWRPLEEVLVELRHGYDHDHVGSRRLRLSFGVVEGQARIVGIQMFEYDGDLKKRAEERARWSRVAAITRTDVDGLHLDDLLADTIARRDELMSAALAEGVPPDYVAHWHRGFSGINAYGRPRLDPRHRENTAAEIADRETNGEQRADVVRDLAARHERDVSTINRWARELNRSTG